MHDAFLRLQLGALVSLGDIGRRRDKHLAYAREIAIELYQRTLKEVAGALYRRRLAPDFSSPGVLVEGITDCTLPLR